MFHPQVWLFKIGCRSFHFGPQRIHSSFFTRGVERDKLLLCSMRAMKKYLSQTEQYYPDISDMFFCMSERKERVSLNTISFWFRSVVNHAYASVSENDCRSLRVRKVAMSLLLRRNCAIYQVLKAGTWSSQPSSFEMSPTGIWTPFPLVMWLSSSCGDGVVTLVTVFCGSLCSWSSGPPCLAWDWFSFDSFLLS